MEEWRSIDSYPNYDVSNCGRVRNSKTGRVLKPGRHKQGYSLVWLSKAGKTKGRSVHSLVANAFIPNPENKPQVNHLDGDKSNNHIGNLEWSTGSENTLHAYRTSLNKGRSRTPVLVIETGEKFNSIKECAAAIHGDSSDICACIHGRIESYKGLHFRSE